IGIAQLPHDLLRTMPRPTFRRHCESLLAHRAKDLHNNWISFSTAGQSVNEPARFWSTRRAV
ncbi:MAG TPA: hypothetical protein VMJ32_04760, partial [Pirellulales bacterium]|nr:hypothetical protein [Pirellulales bacterium]